MKEKPFWAIVIDGLVELKTTVNVLIVGPEYNAISNISQQLRMQVQMPTRLRIRTISLSAIIYPTTDLVDWANEILISDGMAGYEVEVLVRTARQRGVPVFYVPKKEKQS